MDEGTDARDILENKLLPLRRGETHTRPQKIFLILKIGMRSVILITIACLCIFRLHWRCEPKSERHRWEKRHWCCYGCREKVLPVPSGVQTLGRAHGHATSTKDSEPGLLEK